MKLNSPHTMWIFKSQLIHAIQNAANQSFSIRCRHYLHQNLVFVPASRSSLKINLLASQYRGPTKSKYHNCHNTYTKYAHINPNMARNKIFLFFTFEIRICLITGQKGEAARNGYHGNPRTIKRKESGKI